jgi:hypothetical protein
VWRLVVDVESFEQFDLGARDQCSELIADQHHRGCGVHHAGGGHELHPR